MEFPAVGWRYGDSSGTLYYAGTDDYYWSSVTSTSNSNNAYGLYFSSSNLRVSNYDKRNGFSVRCVRQ
ncbi:MAG: fibrobacter succinogenes major paralogous domain-containing protein [Rikenellaceae bacterium]|nr:fibrobacter succinogenes major paralogous domain-containing protein [Rikenellaceae bacterium]